MSLPITELVVPAPRYVSTAKIGQNLISLQTTLSSPFSSSYLRKSEFIVELAQIIGFFLLNIRVRRPFDQLSQPYPSNCSKLCNHPIDPEIGLPATLQEHWVGRKNDFLPYFVYEDLT